MKVAAVQFKGRKADPEGSLAELVALADRAAAGADLVVLPEMAATGYVFESADHVRSVAEPADGPTLAALAPVAKAHGSWVVCGFPEVDGERLFNSAIVVDPKGALAFTYRKTLLYEADVHWATPGDSGYRRLDTDHGSFGVGICMDLNDDRFVGWARAEQLDVVAMPTNWIEEGDDVWGYWAWRMLGLEGALVAANTWGPEGTGERATAFSGASAVIRQRTVLAAAPKVGNGFIVAELPPSR